MDLPLLYHQLQIPLLLKLCLEVLRLYQIPFYWNYQNLIYVCDRVPIRKLEKIPVIASAGFISENYYLLLLSLQAAQFSIPHYLLKVSAFSFLSYLLRKPNKILLILANSLSIYLGKHVQRKCLLLKSSNIDTFILHQCEDIT